MRSAESFQTYISKGERGSVPSFREQARSYMGLLELMAVMVSLLANPELMVIAVSDPQNLRTDAKGRIVGTASAIQSGGKKITAVIICLDNLTNLLQHGLTLTLNITK